MLVLALAAAFFFADRNLLDIRNHKIYTVDSKNLLQPIASFQNIPAGGNLPEQEMTIHWQFDLVHYKHGNSRMNLAADNCILAVNINGKPFPRFNQRSYCGIDKEITIDTAPYIHEGANKIDVQILAKGKKYNLFYKPISSFSNKISADPLILSIILLPFLYLWWAVFLPKGTPLRLPLTLVFISAASLYLMRYLTGLPHLQMHDFTGHQTYVQHIVKYLSLPPIDCWECYQPPAFYIFGAATVKAANLLGQINLAISVRFLSLLVYLVFCGFSFILLKKLNLKPWLTVLGFALFMLWPLAPVKASDFNNDVFVASSILLSFYFTLEWYNSQRLKALVFALAVASIGMFIKSTSIVSFAIIGGVMLLAILEKKFSIKNLSRADYILAFLLSAIIGSLWVLHLQIDIGTHKSAFVYHTVKGYENLWIEDNKLSHYLKFPLKDYIDPPFFFNFESSKYFWPSFFKTVLHGEWWWKSKTVSSFTNILLLFMILYVAAARPKMRPHFIALGMLMAMLLAFRISQPAICNQDIRYIYAAMPLFCIIYVASIQHFLQKRQFYFAYAGIAAAIQMVICAVIIITTQYMLD